MKVYIENYDPKKLLSKMTKLNENMVESKDVIFIYSEDGIFEIDDNKIFQLEPFSENSQRIHFNNEVVFWVDYTIMKKEIVHYVPSEHISIETQINTYQLNKMKNKNDIKMVIHVTKQNGKMIPYDFYIEMNNEENLTNNFVKENLNVFLSWLN